MAQWGKVNKRSNVSAISYYIDESLEIMPYELPPGHLRNRVKASKILGEEKVKFSNKVFAYEAHVNVSAGLKL